MSLAACGGGSSAGTAAQTAAAPPTTTAAEVPSLEERAKLFAYDDSAPPKVVVKGKKTMHGAQVEDIAYSAPNGDVRAYLVQPDGKARAVVLWMHWFGEESNTNRTEFLPDATALAKDGSSRSCPRARFLGEEA